MGVAAMQRADRGNKIELTSQDRTSGLGSGRTGRVPVPAANPDIPYSFAAKSLLGWSFVRSNVRSLTDLRSSAD